MTPEREKYIAKCSKWEKILRHWIEVAKSDIKRHKFFLNNAEAVGEPKNLLRLAEIRFYKDRINCYRHELQRIKGMDRVVVPYEVMRFGFEANIPRVSYNCECFEPIDRKFKYCPQCGKRILWEKVSK